MKPETAFRQRKVIPFLKTLKNTAYFPIQQLAMVGDPDFLLCVFGKFVALELKATKEDLPRKLQQYKLDWVIRAHGVSLVANPDNWDRIKTILTQLDGGRL